MYYVLVEFLPTPMGKKREFMFMHVLVGFMILLEIAGFPIRHSLTTLKQLPEFGCIDTPYHTYMLLE